MTENKCEIIEWFGKALKLCRGGSDIVKIEYSRDKWDEWVVITFVSGHQKSVNVNCDSGVSMMKDVLAALS